MESPFFGEMLILFLMLLNCSRIFLLKYGKIDSLTVLAPICVILAVLQIFAWNVDIFSISILVISIFCFFTNFRAFLRFINGLYVDHYSAAFKTGAIFIIVLCFAEGAILVKFRPVILNKKEYNTIETKIRLSGDFLSGFEKSKYFENASAEIKIIQPAKKELLNGKTIILLADKRADSVEYVPFMQILASNGYKIYCGDFYARDGKWFRNFLDTKILRKFCMKASYFKNPVQFEMQKEFYSFNMKKEISAMLNFVVSEQKQENPEEENSLIFVVGDWMSDVCFDDFKENPDEKPTEISGFFKLSSIEEYKSKGFGFVQQTSPFTAHFLNLKREPKLENLKIVAEKTLSAIPEITLKQVDSDIRQNDAQ